MAELTNPLCTFLATAADFAEKASGICLRIYQRQVAEAVANSVFTRKGLTFVVIFPRQSGKNELQAQIETYLLVLLCQKDAEIVKVSPTWKPQSLNAMRRLERILNRNCFTLAMGWHKEQGYIFRVGSARIFFLSGGPTANVVGATASTLLECDEAQDVTIAKWDKEINPMAASTNATKVFWGTAWTSQTLLAREMRAALAAQKKDGIKRVFKIDADQVGKEVPAYKQFVKNEIARLGKNHPFVLTQYFSKEIDAEAGMFPAARQALMRGAHPPLASPIHSFVEGGGQGGGLYAFAIDVAGSDEGSYPFPGGRACPGQAGGQGEGTLDAKSSRDSTTLTIFEIDLTTLSDPLIKAPRYLVRNRFLWTNASQTTLYSRLSALYDLWKPHRTIVDSTGIGAGLASFLYNSYPGVIQFIFTQKSKSDLGWGFITVIESGRFKDHITSSVGAIGDRPLDPHQEEFYKQLSLCQMEINPGPNRLISWGVPDGTRDPVTGALVHDDLVISAALCAQLDDETWGSAESDFVKAPDIFDGLSF